MAGVVKGLGTVAKNTVFLPFTRPKLAMALAGGTAMLVVMAHTGVGLGESFGAVTGNIAASGVEAAKTAIPYAFNATVSNAPAIGSSVAGWGQSVWAAGTAGATAGANAPVVGVLAPALT